MPLHTDDFANTVSQGLKGKSTPKKASVSMDYHGVDIGAYLDFSAINDIVQKALKKIPKGRQPAGAENWTVSIVIHPGEAEGAAWIMEHNPYKTWAW